MGESEDEVNAMAPVVLYKSINQFFFLILYLQHNI
jgi:hypothetical protein